jgi:hypothetical protein
MKNLLGNLKAPLILVFYGFFLILIQIVMIRFLVFLSEELSRSILIQVVVVALYLCFNAALLYSWYVLTMYVRNKFSSSQP